MVGCTETILIPVQEVRETPSSTVNVQGAWTWNADMQGSGVVCSFRNVRLYFVQRGTAFEGQYYSGTLDCRMPTGERIFSTFQGPIYSGAVSGPNLIWDFENADFRARGRLDSDGVIRGFVDWRWAYGANPVIYRLSGQMTAWR